MPVHAVVGWKEEVVASCDCNDGQERAEDDDDVLLHIRLCIRETLEFNCFDDSQRHQRQRCRDRKLNQYYTTTQARI